MYSKPPPPPASSPELDESALITAAALVVLTLAALYFSNKAAMPPLKTPKELAAAKALRSKLSDPALLVEFGDADYEAVRTGATWDPTLLKPRKKGDNAARVWSSVTHGTETWNMDAAGVPSAICRCATVADVQAVVKHAAAIQLQHTLCVAGGRHSHLSMLDDALVLDLSLMRDCVVTNPGPGRPATVTCQGGALNGDALMACAPHGLGFTVGAHPGTGLGGLVLQGGHGALERTTGLSIDSLVSCTVVLASGEVVTASVKENTDLFWALRGGCGNFGVVVSFTFKLHKIGEGGSVMQSQRVHLPFAPMVKLLGWPDRAACIRAWCDAMQAPGLAKEVHGAMIILCGGPVIHVEQAFTPTLKEGRDLLEAIPVATSFGKPVDASLAPVSYFHDASFLPFGPGGDGQLRGCYYQSGLLMEELPEAAVLAMATAGAATPGKEGALLVTTLGGAVCEVADDATAYSHRAAKFYIVIFARWAPSADAATYAARRATAKKWVHDTKAALSPYRIGAYGQLAGSGSAYAVTAPVVKPLSTDEMVVGEEPSATAEVVSEEEEAHSYVLPGQSGLGWHAEKLKKLRAIKAKYDANDVFVNTDHVAPLA